jgi:hypothetical protein
MTFVVLIALMSVIVLAWHLAQQNVIGREPLARVIALSYAFVAIGGLTWALEPWLPFGFLGGPAFVVAVALNFAATSWRLTRLYEQK